jgi:hypothetical protein
MRLRAQNSPRNKAETGTAAFGHPREVKRSELESYGPQAPEALLTIPL